MQRVIIDGFSRGQGVGRRHQRLIVPSMDI